MSQENVELVRRSFEAFNARNVDGLVGLYDPDFELTFISGPRAGTHKGFERVWAVIEDLLGGFDIWISEPLEFIESGDQVVAIVANRLRPKGGTSGEFEYRNGSVYTIHDGMILSLVGYPTPEAALEAVGLSE
jgi:ketosteroid isomerase-like protein